MMNGEGGNKKYLKFSKNLASIYFNMRFRILTKLNFKE